MCVCVCLCFCLCDHYIALEDGWRVRDSQLREQEQHRKRVRWMERHTKGTTEERRGVRMWGFFERDGWDPVWGDRGEGCDTCGPDRCFGHSHRLSERQRQCEKLMCPTYSSWAETGEGGRAGGGEAGMMLDFGSRQTMLYFFFSSFVHCITPICLWVWVCACNSFSFMFSQHAAQLCCSVLGVCVCVCVYHFLKPCCRCLINFTDLAVN